MTRWSAASVLLLAFGTGGVRAQEPAEPVPTAASLSAAARRVSEELADPAAATAAGYRRVGPDFPGMGEHWVQLGLLFADRLDPEHPSVLCYTHIGGKSVLVNVAYALALPPGRPPPSVAGLTPGDWHTHGGTVEEEMLHPHGHADHGGGASGITMIHVWTRVENPDGEFAQYDWLLPFRRLSLPDPESPPGRSAGDAASLATESGFAYHLEVVHLLLAGDPGRLRAGSEALDWAARRAKGIVDASRASGRVSADDLERLRAVWHDLGRELDALAPDAHTREMVRTLHELTE